jgi:predicted lipid-binding transport protein (Tim44 family)
MKKILLVLLLLMTAWSLTMTFAEAKPKQGAKQHASETVKSADAEEPADEAPPPPDTSWKGVLGGVVVSMGAGGLAAKLGMQPATFGVCAALLAPALLVIVILMLGAGSRRRRKRRNATYAGDYSNSVSSNRPARAEPKMGSRVKHNQEKQHGAAATKARSRVDVPAEFDLAKFLRSANSLFLRLQNAWDQGDINDIREFANDEIRDELALQLRTRRETQNKTGIDSLDSKLLKLDSGGEDYVAVVKFNGMIREEGNPSKAFMEVWSMTKPRKGTATWTVTAIQQFL